MKTIEQMLRHLARPDVAEFAIATGRLPCIKVEGKFQPVDQRAPTTDEILQMLVAVGGSRHVDSLSAQPSQWSARVDGVGVLAVAAVMRDDKVQARFVVSKRAPAAAEARPAAPAAAPPAAREFDIPETAVVHPRTPSAAGKRPSARPPRTPSAGSRTPPSAGSRTPSFAGGKVPLPKTDLELEAPASRPAARGVDVSRGAPHMPGAMREIDLGEHESPTRPGLPGGVIELELDNPRLALEGHAPAATARDFELDLETREQREAREHREARRPPSAPPATVRRSVSDAGGLDDLVASARAASASDLHVVAERPALFRIGGELTTRGEPLDAAAVEAILVPNIPVRCRDALDRDGSCDFAWDHPLHGRFRVNVTRQRTGLKACLRLIGREVPTLAALGLPPEIAKATHHHQGLIVVTGPTGHGKTTTLAAIVDIVNSETTHHVITVEDPVEYVHPKKRAVISQREVGTHTRSFQAALKASLREDPDVIVVGELRDTETVRMALSASETGHLVLGTMNTPSAAKTIDRLVDLFPPADQQQVRMTLAGGLRLIVSQRLLPSSSGQGMVAAVELLPGSVALWNLIRDAKTYQIPSLQQRGRGAGILRLDDSLADLVSAGATTREAALAVAEQPDELDAKLAGRRVAPPPGPQRPAQDAQGSAAALLQRAGSLFGGRKG